MTDGDEDLRVDALRAYAIAARRLRHYDDAEAAWRQVLGLPVRQPLLRPGVVLRYWSSVHLPDQSFASLRGDRA